MATEWIIVHQVKEGDGSERPESFIAYFNYRETAMDWIKELRRLGADRLGLYKQVRYGNPKLSRKWGKFDDEAWG